MKKFRTISRSFHVSIQGKLWWPMGAVAHKEYKVAIGDGPWQKEWTNARDMISDALNDGDLHSTGAISADVCIERCWQSAAGTTTYRRRWVSLASRPDLADLFVEEDLAGCPDDEEVYA